MPRIKPLTEEGRRKAINANRDDEFRRAIGAWTMANGGCKALSAKTGIAYRTLLRRIEMPETVSTAELRRFNDVGCKIPASFMGL